MILGIYGAGGLGREVYIIADSMNRRKHRWDEIVFIDDDKDNLKNIGKKIYMLSELDPGDLEVVIAVGNPNVREILYNRVKEKGISLATLIHPDVHVEENHFIGEGAIISAGVYLGDSSMIENNVCLMPQTLIGHDSVIGEHSVLAPNSNISGNVKIGSRTFMGFLSGVKQNLMIGDDVICSAGAIVFQNIPDGVVAVGNPARIVRKNERKKVF